MKRLLNICIVSQEYAPYTNWGGIAIYYSELTKAYSQLGHRVTVVSRSSQGAPRHEEPKKGFDIWRVGIPMIRKYFTGRTIDRMLHAKKIYKKVKELDDDKPFDIIETSELGLDGEVLLNDTSFRRRMVIQCHGGNVHGVVPHGMLSFLHHLDWKWSFRREQRSLRQVPQIIVPSEATRNFLLKEGIDGCKIRLIFEGIDTDRFRPRSQPLEQSPLEVGFVGRLEKIKGIDFVWKVMERIGEDAGIRFHFKGAIHPSMKKEVQKNLKRFCKFAVYHLPSEHNNMQEFYQSLHVLLQPSRFENFGLAYTEGMACGLVVFAGKKGSGPEIVKENVTGYLIDPDGEVDFVVSKLKEIAANPLASNNMGCKAREDVIERFSLQTCASNKIAYYRELNGECSDQLQTIA